MSDPWQPALLIVWELERKNCIYCTTKKNTQIRIAALSCQPVGPFKQPGLGREKLTRTKSHNVPNAGRNIVASLHNFRIVIVVRRDANDCEGDQNVSVSVSHQVHDNLQLPRSTMPLLPASLRLACHPVASNPTAGDAPVRCDG